MPQKKVKTIPQEEKLNYVSIEPLIKQLQDTLILSKSITKEMAAIRQTMYFPRVRKVSELITASLRSLNVKVK